MAVKAGIFAWMKFRIKIINMKKSISKKQFEIAEKKINDLLAIAVKKGGFVHLTKKENTKFKKYTKIVQAYEELHFIIPLPKALQEIPDSLGNPQ